ncbi:hypothetical protein ACFLQR_00790 [Verrucomicrobiota bacterium]
MKTFLNKRQRLPETTRLVSAREVNEERIKKLKEMPHFFQFLLCYLCYLLFKSPPFRVFLCFFVATSFPDKL